MSAGPAAVTALAVLAGAAGVRHLLDRRGGSAARRRLAGDRSRRPAWSEPPALLARAIAAAALPLPTAVVWSIWWAATAAVGVAAVLVSGLPLALLALVASGAGAGGVLVARRHRSMAVVEAALPALLDDVARSLRSGASLVQALAETGSPELERVVSESRAGVPLADALAGWSVRCPAGGVRLTAAALGLAADAGGAAARAVDGVAATLRANLAVAAEVRALSSQARLSAVVIALAPIAFGALAAGTDGRTATFLLRTPVGLACVAGGLVLDGAAAFWMHRITAGPA